MRQKTLLLTLCVLSYAFSFAQSLTSCGGESVNNANYYFEYALGEPCIQTLTSPNNQFTQGLLQPDLFYKMIVVRADTLKIPNSFSPNRDGINDRWVIKALETQNCTVEVFNRYGQSIYLNKGYYTGWDGKYNNKDLPIATYYYLINIPGDKNVYSGWLLLIK
jgi:gliding motility-associated-like protein